ncbi:MAG: beta-lactamase [Desulfatitalea sp. BRH_c12]|nr:MAG: beta-lactamase [Desulfatitalea sp. BRH_c12]
MTHDSGKKEVRILILVDNQVTNGLLAEHGFALWIDTGTELIVFDTGQGHALPQNARQLGIDWSQADHLVLSHGHFDHTGGLRHILTEAHGIHVHCHPGVVQPRYSIRLGKSRPIQMPSHARTALDHVPEQCLHWVLQPTMLSERVGLSGPIPRAAAFEDTGGPFYLDPAGRRPDPIDDDLALWIRTDQGLVVCVGCCHAGLINTLQHILHLNPGEKIRAIIGGFHLLNASGNRLRHTIAALRSLAPGWVIPCHCTGEYAVAALHDSLGQRVCPGAAGKEYRI